MLFRLLGVVLFGYAAPTTIAQSNVRIDGLSWLDNGRMERQLAFMLGVEASEPLELSAINVEDCGFLVLQLLREAGFADPALTAEFEFADGTSSAVSWGFPLNASKISLQPFDDLPITLRLSCQPGIRQFYHAVRIDGIDIIDTEAIVDFFIPRGVLFTQRRERAYTPANLRSRVRKVLQFLADNGFPSAQLRDSAIALDPASGAVTVALSFDQGPLHVFGPVDFVGMSPVPPAFAAKAAALKGTPLTQRRLMELRQFVLNFLYTEGFPDAEVELESSPQPLAAAAVAVALRCQIVSGPQVQLAPPVFEPTGVLRPSVLRRQARLQPGGPYDLLQVEGARRRILALGVLNAVDLEHRPIAADLRQPVYSLEPGDKERLSLRVGYGSYEQGRIGLRYQRFNLLRRAHRMELTGKLSFKASLADLTYFVPHFFDEDITGFISAAYETRDEIGYDRASANFSVGGNQRLPLPGAEFSVAYRLEKIDTTRTSDRVFIAPDSATVASLNFRLNLDRRDSPLYPTKGFDANASLKVASDAMGGNANYLRTEVGLSGHLPVSDSLTLHGRLRLGAVFSASPANLNLPFDDRFFPGGENSVRGYQRGEASPVSAAGDPLGAEAFLLANIELEQRVLRNWSLVLFYDAVRADLNYEGFPTSPWVDSVGLGIRWRTPVGPLRLEYGHNLNRRPLDPTGTLHFSVGFPF